ncbi:MAG: tRNA (pseudouridine(54)-N(1))-methyltransferase TrmY [Haloarculaceae archaeon]
MRRFLVAAHEVPADGEFPLDDLPGAGGRVDVLARCVGSAFLLSHAIREDVRLWIAVRDELTVRFDGAELRNLAPDERSTAARIRDAIAAREEAIGHQPARVSPGVETYRRGFEATLRALADGATTVALHEDGEPVVEVTPPEDPLFVLSDHREFTDREASALASVADRRVRLGPETIHADGAITVAHNWLDTDGFTRY